MNHGLKNRLTQFFIFTLIFNFLSLKFIPNIRHLISKTLNFLQMDSLFFSSSDDSTYDDGASGSLFGNNNFRSIHSLSDLDNERLYIVDHRWWNEAREALFSGIDGVLYDANAGFLDEFEQEIVLEMRTSGDDGDDCENVEEELGVSGREYALISEWMFYRSLKWHYDMKNVGHFVSTEDNKVDLFTLQVKLSISGTNSLIVRISQKGNEMGAFNKSCQIFCVVSTLKIWDFSGQITNFYLQGRSILFDKPEQIFLKLQVYGLYFDVMQQANEMPIEDLNSSVKANGHTDKVNSHVKFHHPLLDNRYNEAYNLGLTGLYNLGNTCYMNSAIQCLAHTPHFVDYFLGDFRKDLNFENPLGKNGKLALAFGDLIRQLWTPRATSVAPRAFKSRLGGFAPQFSGFNQHDSQEFLAFLLDGLHEDLNRVKTKPYNEIKYVDGVSDKEVADEHWRNHLARNDSIIVDMCQGQYRSTLICPVCKKHSVTFDPFLYLSLPLPSPTMRTMTLTVLSTDGSTLPIPVTVTVPKIGKFKDLIEALSTACSLGSNETLLVAEIYNYHILHFLDKLDDSIELVRDDDLLVAYKLLKDEDSLPLVVFTHISEVLTSLGFPHLKKFGIPLVAKIPDCSDGFEIHKTFLKLLQPFLNPEEFSADAFDDLIEIVNQDDHMDDKVDDFTINIDSNINIDEEVDDMAIIDASNTKIDDKVDELAIIDTSDMDDKVDKMSNSDVSDSKVNENFEFRYERYGLWSEGSKIVMDEPILIPSSHEIYVLVTWSDEMMKRYDTTILSRLPGTGELPLFTNKPPESVSLYKCLEAFLKEEPLGPEDMWYCPKCEIHRQASKKLDLWRLPEILIVHLKRFSYNEFLSDKLETFVDFPIDGFDLSNFTVHKNCEPSFCYKLYAVSNHYGGLGGGHYTAFAQCGEQWYEFNDSQVFPISEDQIKTSAAYVLFYKRI
ncbi:ubiquitin carboxyl-terminal hydrolase 8-like [Rutidosis leptorrhynchoides]|uniref:ubiquitin carboxyl-terminal hydrolase 8-like n=1 Tax=Rutidosis leptorrhynchoides TaxID=125765 RepID=UPI003A98FE15